MAIISIPHTHQQLNEFAEKQWEKTLAFLQGQFSLSRVDCEDIFQDSFIVLYNNILSGKLDSITASLSTYFNAICRNKAFELMRANGKEINIVDKYPEITKDEFEDEKIDRILALEDDTEQSRTRKDAIVREVVKKLPEPCDKVLWGFYRDGFSMKTLAAMYNYKSEGVVKVTKHRCGEKFRNRFLEVKKYLFD